MTAKPKTNLKKLDISWNGVKKAMGSVESYLSSLQAFDRDNFPPENKEYVRGYTGPPEQPDPSFNFDAMKSKSVAAAGLCDWVCNMCTYHDMCAAVARGAMRPCASRRSSCRDAPLRSARIAPRAARTLRASTPPTRGSRQVP